MNYIKKFEDISIDDVALVGGKNASLGQMITHLAPRGVTIPTGFAITAKAYWHFIEFNNLLEPLKKQMALLTDAQDLPMLQKVGSAARALLEAGTLPPDLAAEISSAYKELCKRYKQDKCDVAVRSSATAEDLPGASFAGQQETYLNIKGEEALLKACVLCIASLFTDRAIVYRMENGFDHFQVALSIGVQKMIRSDKACAGVAFSLDTETGFKDVVMINASYGLGETIVKGSVVPDEFFVHKPTLQKGFAPIIKKLRGDKRIKMIYTNDIKNPTQTVEVPAEDRNHFALTDAEVLTIARAVVAIEDHYSERNGTWTPMDVEWAKDGTDGILYIVQARPETVYAGKKNGTVLRSFVLSAPAGSLKTLVTGQSIGGKIATGKACVISSVADIDKVNKGDVLVTEMTDPDWTPIMKKASAIITQRGGRSCHAAIVSRELGIPAIVGAQDVLDILQTGQEITIDCSKGSIGYVYEGIVPFEEKETELTGLTTPPVPVMLNLADPDNAFRHSFLPCAGVGLARMEFIISGTIKVHPLALLHPEKITDEDRKHIQELTSAYKDPKDFYVDALACSIGHIAAAFFPKPVIVRFSDFKTNEYRNLIGGAAFEPTEENPMLGFRGASRYVSEQFAPAFALECQALKKVRDVMGLTNVKAMVPFVRTVTEGQKVIDLMAQHGLARGSNDLQIIMMCEIPSNVLLIDDFSKVFDGFSIGSNDLTQMTLGVDRDSGILAHMFDERDPAVKKMLEMAIVGAQRNKKPIGICGQAPSDYFDLAKQLIAWGITSISLNPDSVVPFMMQKFN